MVRRINAVKERRICEDYTAGRSIIDISKARGICTATAYNVLVRRGIEIRDAADSARKYTLNEHYFDEIDSEDKAYFLGLLYSDGYNNRKRRETVLQLDPDDKIILETFGRCVGTNKPLKLIKSKKYKDMWRITLCSEPISKRLEELGCGNNKSLILRYPNWMHDNLQRHFIRGYFDGDGCIGFAKRDGHYSSVHWEFVSTKEFCEAAKDVIMMNVDANVTVRKIHSSGIHELSIGGRLQTLELCKWLYSDAKYYLPRKHARYIELRDKAPGLRQIHYCTIRECNERAHGAGLCKIHYGRISREMKRKGFDGTVEEYLESRKKIEEKRLSDFIGM